MKTAVKTAIKPAGKCKGRGKGKGIAVPTLKPRNPLVAAARFRVAGAHRQSIGGQRQQAQRALQRELRQTERQHHKA